MAIYFVWFNSSAEMGGYTVTKYGNQTVNRLSQRYITFGRNDPTNWGCDTYTKPQSLLLKTCGNYY